MWVSSKSELVSKDGKLISYQTLSQIYGDKTALVNLFERSSSVDFVCGVKTTVRHDYSRRLTNKTAYYELFGKQL